MATTVPIADGQRIGELERFYPQISRYALTLLHDRADAQDATQDTFLRAALRHDSLRDPGAALSWLYSIATHV
jgi:DNA-directed RNA polymerase specialized sigma24 family protein